ncbi:transcription factor MafF [Biomphalaria glabrata]|nr:transcription factor MafF [Biomphalaria glabrata]
MSLTSIIIAVVGSLLELNHHQSSSATSCPGSTPITAPFQHPQPRGQEHNSRSLYSVSQSTQSSIKLPHPVPPRLTVSQPDYSHVSTFRSS